MASGGSEQSILGGNDIVPDFPCKKCEEGDSYNEAIAYCRQCDETYCKLCLKDHNRFVKGHTVLGHADKDDWGKPIVSQGIGVECSEHEGQDISLYCAKHDSVCCPVCAVVHHSDKCRPKMQYIRKAAQGLATRDDYLRFMTANDRLFSRTTQTESNKSESMSALVESREKCLADAEEMQIRLTDHIKSCTDRSIAQINNLHDDVEGKLAEEIANCTDIKQKLSKIRTSMHIKGPLDEALAFVTMKTSKEELQCCESSLRMLNEATSNTYTFQGGAVIKQLIRVTELGDCIENATDFEGDALNPADSLTGSEDVAQVRDKETVTPPKLENIPEKAVFKKEFTDSTIQRLNPTQVSQIKAIAKQYHVGIQFDDRRGTIALSGMATNIMDVTDKIYGVFREADELEHITNEASLIAKITQWYYKTETRLIKYDEPSNRKIEKAFQAHQPTVKLIDNSGFVYIMNFSKVVAYPEGNPIDTVPVIRRDLLKEKYCS